MTKLRPRYRQFAFLTTIAAYCVASSALAFSPDSDLTARAAILMDATSGSILYATEPDLRLPPASTTKVLTAIVALESGRNLQQSLKVSKAATRVPASKLYLRPNQALTIEDLLYGILLSSANDASLVLAEGLGGSVERFTELMTKKAYEIGATNSHFSNPHGLTASDHYSTARDIAILFRYAMRNPTFREIVQTKMTSVSSYSETKKKVFARRISVRNHNRLLWNFNGTIGGKTGYTHAAQKCFVGAVARNGVTLIVSLLGARDLWGDTKKLLEYGFDNYEALKTANSRWAPGPGSGQSSGSEPLPAFFTAPHDDSKAQSLNGYFLQIGSFREHDRAEAVLKQVSDKGFDAFIEKTTLNEGQTAYRVRLGPYARLPEAKSVAQKILDTSGYEPLIVPLLVLPEHRGGAR